MLVYGSLAMTKFGLVQTRRLFFGLLWHWHILTRQDVFGCLRPNVFWSFLYYERSTLGDQPKLQLVANKEIRLKSAPKSASKFA